jgi:hypothetical protein
MRTITIRINLVACESDEPEALEREACAPDAAPRPPRNTSPGSASRIACSLTHRAPCPIFEPPQLEVGGLHSVPARPLASPTAAPPIRGPAEQRRHQHHIASISVAASFEWLNHPAQVAGSRVATDAQAPADLAIGSPCPDSRSTSRILRTDNVTATIPLLVDVPSHERAEAFSTAAASGWSVSTRWVVSLR